MLDKNELAELFPFVICFLVAVFLLPFAHLQSETSTPQPQSVHGSTSFATKLLHNYTIKL